MVLYKRVYITGRYTFRRRIMTGMGKCYENTSGWGLERIYARSPTYGLKESRGVSLYTTIKERYGYT